MRVVQKKIKDESSILYYEQFESYQEFLKVVEERDRTNAHRSENRLNEIASEGDWCGVKDYDEARRLLINGWDAKVQQLKEEFKKALDGFDEKKVVITNFAGFRVKKGKTTGKNHFSCSVSTNLKKRIKQLD